MRGKTFAFLALASGLLVIGLWVAHPPASRANGEKDNDKGGHAHVPAPLEYADAHVPLAVWTDPAMIARGKEIYTVRCAVCHGDAGDGKGPAGVGLPLKPSDFRDKAGVAEMRDNYWFWRVSEGGTGEPFKSKGSAMPPWKGELSVQDRWAVMAYQHTFSGHQGPHVPWEHPESIVVGRDIYVMACLPCHGVDGKGDGTVAATLSPRRAPQPRDLTTAEFMFRSTPSGQLPTTADLFRTVTEGVRGPGGVMTIGLRGYRIMPSFRHMPEEQRLERGVGDAECDRGLVVGEPVELAQDDGVALLPGQLGERLAEGLRLGAGRRGVLDVAGRRGDVREFEGEPPIVRDQLLQTEPVRFSVDVAAPVVVGTTVAMLISIGKPSLSIDAARGGMELLAAHAGQGQDGPDASRPVPTMVPHE